MPQFDISMVRTATCTKTISVNAANRLQAQGMALDQAGDHLYKEQSATYELDTNDKRNADEFTGLPSSQLVIETYCDNEDAIVPAYVVLDVTPALVRSIKEAMLLCTEHKLLKVVLPIAFPISWGTALAIGQIDVTKVDFCVSTGMRHSSSRVQGINVMFNDLISHIASGKSETIFAHGMDQEKQELRDLFEWDKADAMANETGAEQPQG